MDFGTLCHSALEAMGRDPAWRVCPDAAALREFLRAEFDRRVRTRFGAELTLPLLVQVESAHQRLAKAAEVQARTSAEGWAIEAVERKFEIEVGGLTVAGKIDRIERHAVTGAVRVLDYKTSDTAVSPPEAHWRAGRAGGTEPEWMRYAGSGKPRVWADLQLPLYLRALAPEFGENIACGYFNLPKAAGETGLALWEGCTPEVQEAGWRCAEGVCAAIRAGEFWPPRELTGRQAELDEFAALFQQGAAASVAWEGGAR
jgi:ATP-dependent helicase/nuclease subunit B